MPAQEFLKLQDLVLAPPFPAVVSCLIICCIWYLGWRLAVWLRRGDIEALDIAGGFVLSAAAMAAVVHGLALGHLSTLWVLRSFGWSIVAVGGYALVRHGVQLSDVLRREVAELWNGTLIERAGMAIVAITMMGLAASALGPVTDADSLDYHIGVPLDWLRHGGAYPNPAWLHTRTIGLGECLNMLGLAAGTDGLGAALQFSGIIVAGLAVRALASTARDRRLAWLLVVTSPIMVSLVPIQKPQLLPAAASTVAIVLAIRRFADFGPAEILMAVSGAAFSAASKTSFLLSSGFVLLVCLGAARKSGRQVLFLAISTGAFCALLGPVLWRNYVFFGDPISPFLERFRDRPESMVIAFAQWLRIAGGLPTMANIVRLPLRMLAATRPVDLSMFLGLGTLAFLPALAARGVSRFLLMVALACALVTVALGQIAQRFFIEPFFWTGAAMVAAGWSRRKNLLLCGLVTQGVLSASMAIFAATTLFPGALTARQRDRTMSRSASGYAEAQWLDKLLPREAVITGQSRFHALAPRAFASADPVLYDLTHADQQLAKIIQTTGVNTLVVWEGLMDEPFLRLARLCGEPLGEPHRFALATRNPFNREQYGVSVFRLHDCE